MSAAEGCRVRDRRMRADRATSAPRRWDRRRACVGRHRPVSGAGGCCWLSKHGGRACAGIDELLELGPDVVDRRDHPRPADADG